MLEGIYVGAHVAASALALAWLTGQSLVLATLLLRDAARINHCVSTFGKGRGSGHE